MFGVAAAEEIAVEQYAGSFLVEKYAGAQYFWYVDPASRERYAVNSGNDFSRLLSNLSVPVDRKIMAQLPDVQGANQKISLPLLMKYRGTILKNIAAGDKAYYLNPLDLKLYYLHNGKDGFTTAQGLALDISQERLAQIPVTEALGFNYVRSDILTDPAGTINTSVYGDVFKILQASHLYKDNFTAHDLFYGSLKGMAQATEDVNTEFYTPEKNQKQHEYFAGNSSIEGIGAAIDARLNSIYVSWLVKGAPAERAGLKSRDQITAIDGVSTAGMSVDAAVARIKGPAGTKVLLTVYRASSGTTMELSITRERVEIPDVDGELMGDVAYFKFSLFTANLIPQFQKLVEQLITPSVKGIVIDMRDNIGGVTQASAQLVDYWLTDDELIFMERRPGRETRYVASGGRELPQVPTVILTNEETASASEIFTSALKFHKEATVIGTKTYGKGTGQNLYNFEDGSGLKMTTFEWIPADGTSINGIGIVPDIVVQGAEFSDPQLDRALQFIKSGY